MKPNKVGQDFNSTGIKYAGAIDNTAYPGWMPWAFWISVAVCAAIFVALIWLIS